MDHILTLQGDDASVKLDLAAGGRATSVIVAGHELIAQVDRDSVFHWGSYVMAPWAGRIRDGAFQLNGHRHQLPINWPPHAIHGTVVDRPWSVVSSSPASAVVECRLDERWPWPGLVRQVITIGESQLEFRLELHADEIPFPAAIGWHPWFRRRLAAGEDARIELDAAAMLARDPAGIPTGERVPITGGPWDDCFDEVRWPIQLTWPGALQVSIDADTRYAVVYTEQENALCVEPQTGPPDALNLHPVAVHPDRPLTARMSWAWRSLA